MTRKYRFGQSREAQELDSPSAYTREGRAQSKRRQQSADRLSTEVEAHDADAMLWLPDPTSWLHLPEATLIQRHSLWVDLEREDRSTFRATLAGKLKGVKLVVGDRVRYTSLPPSEGTDGSNAGPEAQVVAVMPRKTLLKRGGIDDREPWQLMAANVDELWVCTAVVDPPLRPGLLERAQTLALDAKIAFRIIVTKRDRASAKDTLPELDPLRAQGLSIVETSALKAQGMDILKQLLADRTAVLIGHSGVGKSSLINALMPDLALRTGQVSKYGTGRQTTTASRWIPTPYGGTLIDTPGVRTLSVRGMDRLLLPHIFPELPSEWCEDPMGLDPEDETLDLEYPERLHSLQKLWEEMGEHNPNQRGC